MTLLNISNNNHFMNWINGIQEKNRLNLDIFLYFYSVSFFSSLLPFFILLFLIYLSFKFLSFISFFNFLFLFLYNVVGRDNNPCKRVYGGHFYRIVPLRNHCCNRCCQGRARPKQWKNSRQNRRKILENF